MTFLNPNKRLQYLGIIESINGFGNIISPFVGSVLYSFFGFLYMFLIIGLIHLLFIPLIKLTKHNEVEISNVNDDEVKEIEAISNSEPKLSYCKLFSEPSVILLSLTQCIVSVAYCFFEPVLTFRLLDFTDSVRIQGLVIGCLCLGYCITSFIVPFIATFMIPTT